MPPPNVTGQLHMGHAMDETWQDILTRYKRMQGYAALWVPGTDHASIATEAKVVEAMREGGPDQGRCWAAKSFLERAWAWKNTYGGRIVEPAEEAGLLLRLGARALHHGRGLLQRREGSVRAACMTRA